MNFIYNIVSALLLVGAIALGLFGLWQVATCVLLFAIWLKLDQIFEAKK